MFGLFTIAFSAGLFRSLGQGKAGKVGTVLLSVGGIGVAASGIFRCDPGCPTPGESFSGQMHDQLFVTLIGIILAIFFFSWALPKKAEEGLQPDIEEEYVIDQGRTRVPRAVGNSS